LPELVSLLTVVDQYNLGVETIHSLISQANSQIERFGLLHTRAGLAVPLINNIVAIKNENITTVERGRSDFDLFDSDVATSLQMVELGRMFLFSQVALLG
jgi:butyrate kinase